MIFDLPYILTLVSILNPFFLTLRPSLLIPFYPPRPYILSTSILSIIRPSSSTHSINYYPILGGRRFSCAPLLCPPLTTTIRKLLVVFIAHTSIALLFWHLQPHVPSNTICYEGAYPDFVTIHLPLVIQAP